MPDDPKSEDTGQPNEGEGSRSAARRYNEGVDRSTRSGQVEEKAREAEKALDGAEGKGLERAEAEGKRHIAEEDPAITRKK